MFKTNKVLLTIAAMTLTAGLTGCGKDNYQGTYTGYELRLPATATGTGGTTVPQTGYTGYGYGAQQARAVTLTLTNSGDAVTGTYTVTTPAYGGTTTAGIPAETYSFNGSSANSGSISNIMLFSTTGSYGGYSQYSMCIMQGTLSSQNHGQTITGTLTAAPSAASNCGSLQLNLTRGN
jgi:hypothetical protein